MTATDTQVRIIMRERRRGKTQEQAAAKANTDNRKTVSKYEQLGALPSEMKQARQHRTHPDAFAEDWAEIEEKLQQSPTLEAKTLFAWLCEERKPTAHLSTARLSMAWTEPSIARNRGDEVISGKIAQQGEEK